MVTINVQSSHAVLHRADGCINQNSKEKVVTQMVELDQMKQELQAYKTPLAEVRDSL